jgi:hypothetical protein
MLEPSLHNFKTCESSDSLPWYGETTSVLHKGDMIRYIKIPSIFKVTFSLLLKNLSWKEAGGNVFFNYYWIWFYW